MSKRYKLLKDLPDANVGTILIYNYTDKSYDYTDKFGKESWHGRVTVEESPEWFEEIKEQEIPYTILQKDIDWFGKKIPAGTKYVQHGKDYYWPVIDGAHCPHLQVSFMTVMNNSYFLSPQPAKEWESVKMKKEDVVAPPQRFELKTQYYWAAQRLFTKQEMGDCFLESRLTNSLVGFKWDTIEDYLNSKKA